MPLISTLGRPRLINNRSPLISWFHGRRLLLIAAVVIGTFLFTGLGGYALLNTNEGLYAEIAREMLASGDYLVPHLNGVPYLEKPPLLYWMTALNFSALGMSETAARLVSIYGALLACCASVVLGLATRRRNTAWTSIIVLASSVGFVILARVLLFDMLLCGLFWSAMVAFFTWHLRQNPAWLRASYTLLALAVLTKGPLAIALAIPIVLAFAALSRTRTWRVTQLFDFPGLVFFLGIVLPWFVAIASINPNFASYYIVNENILRYVAARVPRDYYTGSIVYYLPRVFIYFFPWAGLLGLVFITEKWKRARASDLKLFLWLTFLVPAVFFSLSTAKANYYLVIAMPPLAWLIAARFRLLLRANHGRMIAVATMISIPLGLLAIYAIYHQAASSHSASAYFGEVFAIGSVIFVLSSAAAFLSLRRGRHFASLGSLASLSLCMLTLSFTTLKAFSENYSSKPAALVIQKTPNRPVLLFRQLEGLSALPFYLGNPIPIIDSKSNELAYAKNRFRDPAIFISMKSALQLCETAAPIIVVDANDEIRFSASLQGRNPFDRVVKRGSSLLYFCPAHNVGKALPPYNGYLAFQE